jgi:hypothetical protein
LRFSPALHNKHRERVMNSERALSKQIAAASGLRHAMKELNGAEPEDTDLVRDMIEGETSLHETIGFVMDQIREDDLLVAGIEAMAKKLEARKERIKHRISRCRGAVEQAMVIGEITKLVLPDATLTIKAVPPKLEIVDESVIPAIYWVPQEPALNRRAVSEALKAGTPVPGATMGNGGIALQIRRQ